jgi:hypothetical protein
MAKSVWIFALGLAVLGEAALAEDRPPPIELTLKDHQFTPAEVHIPTGKAAFLHVVNQDAAPEEFEVRQLAIERVIAGGGSGEVRLRPLGPGRYVFIGEFHEDTAQGTLVVE